MRAGKLRHRIDIQERSGNRRVRRTELGNALGEVPRQL